MSLQLIHKDLRELVTLPSNLPQTRRTVPLHVEGSHVGKESLRRANV